MRKLTPIAIIGRTSLAAPPRFVPLVLQSASSIFGNAAQWFDKLTFLGRRQFLSMILGWMECLFWIVDEAGKLANQQDFGDRYNCQREQHEERNQLAALTPDVLSNSTRSGCKS